MSIANPYKDPDAYGFVTVGGSRLPGILTSIGLPERVYEFAIQNGYGQSKVTIYKGLGLLDGIEVVHFLRAPATATEKDDFEVLRDDFMPFLIPGWPNNLVGKPRAFPLVHPDAQWLGLKRAHLIGFECPKMQAPGDPSRWYKMRFQEDQPQKRIPVGPPEPAKINGPPAPRDAWEATMLDGLAKWKSTDDAPVGGIFGAFFGG
jgi:hypothetical protein